MQHVHKYFMVVNFVLFQAIWASSVFGRTDWVLVPMALIALHFVLSPSRKADLMVVAMVASAGIVVDLLLTFTGVFVFTPEFFPLWLIVLWCGFATTLNHGLAWLTRFPIYAQAVIGAFGGASSYVAGYFIGAVDFTFSFVLTSCILLLVWSALMPLFLYFTKGAPRYVSSLR